METAKLLVMVEVTVNKDHLDEDNIEDFIKSDLENTVAVIEVNPQYAKKLSET